MNRDYSAYWWVYLMRGLFAIVYGATTIILPTPAFVTLVIFFGTFMVADGIFSIMFSFRANQIIKNRQWLFFLGISGVVAGTLTFFSPFIAAVTLVCLFAFWSFFAGIMEMVRAINLRKEKKKEVLYVASGIISILIAILLLADPRIGTVTLAVIFAIYALTIGLSLIFLSIRLKRKFTIKTKERHHTGVLMMK
ncbi:MAG TPA: DUF308 domain-containing protein [Chitinophagaceae bacterium]|nr:DUF308 domain-containing protein [Chitinophagaceae bacterium]